MTVQWPPPPISSVLPAVSCGIHPLRRSGRVHRILFSAGGDGRTVNPGSSPARPSDLSTGTSATIYLCLENVYTHQNRFTPLPGVATRGDVPCRCQSSTERRRQVSTLRPCGHRDRVGGGMSHRNRLGVRRPVLVGSGSGVTTTAAARRPAAAESTRWRRCRWQARRRSGSGRPPGRGRCRSR